MTTKPSKNSVSPGPIGSRLADYRSDNPNRIDAGLLGMAELSMWGPLLLSIKQAQHRQNRALELALAPLDMSLAQWNAMCEIDRNPGESLHELAERTFVSDQAFGMLAARLIKLGFVSRRSGAGRATIHELTSLGRDRLAAGAAAIAEAASELFRSVDLEKRRRLEELLGDLIKD